MITLETFGKARPLHSIWVVKGRIEDDQMTDGSEAKNTQEEYDIEYETMASRNMLEKRIPDRLNAIKLEIVETDKRRSYEPWRLALLVDLGEAIERNAEQLLETMGKNRLPASAWLARNLLELLVWVRYCAASRENAWRFHEDALRDVKGLLDAHEKTCAAMGIVDEMAAFAAERVQQVASEKLGLDEIDAKYLAVADAARADGVGLGDRFAPSYRWLSKFAHPTAGLIHGITHQAEACHQLQAVCTTQGVYYAAQCTLATEAQLGISSAP
jgi:hypothetical protein